MKHKQKQTIYMLTSIGNIDNTVDFADEEPQTFDDPEDAVAKAKADTKEYGMLNYVYKCVPVFRVDRGKIRVTKL